jgi:hypothetical protein
LVDDHSGSQLHVEGPKLNGAMSRHAHGAKDLRKQFVQGFAAASSASQLKAPLLQICVRKPTKFFFPITNGVDLQSGTGQPAL